MFQGHAGLSMAGDHLDISYNDPESWPKLTPSGSIRAFVFHVGDPEAGPCVQLGLIRPVEGETLDWRHSIDPLHHHGSDQFRAIVTGNWNLAGRPLAQGDYAFQESGIVYQEHPGPSGAASIMLLMGDRRGNQATIARKQDEDRIFEYDEIYGAPKADQAYPHPAGDRGIAAVNTTAGRCNNGYLRGAIEALEGGERGALTGVLGDHTSGPAVHVIHGRPGETVMPSAIWPTEVVMLIVAGSVELSARTYGAGELRVQQSDAAMGAIVAGGAGAELVFIVADRRAEPTLASPADTLPSWLTATARVTANLQPAAGGPQTASRRAGR